MITQIKQIPQPFNDVIPELNQKHNAHGVQEIAIDFSQPSYEADLLKSLIYTFDAEFTSDGVLVKMHTFPRNVIPLALISYAMPNYSPQEDINSSLEERSSTTLQLDTKMEASNKCAKKLDLESAEKNAGLKCKITKTDNLLRC